MTTFSAVLIALVPLGVQGTFDFHESNRETAGQVRDLKAPIYKEMSEASYEYGRAQSVKHNCQQATATDCPVTDEALEEARSRFENARGDIFMFGSPEAMSAVSRMTMAGLNPNLKEDGSPEIGPVDLDSLRRANLDFQIAVCEEARADECESR